MAWLGSLRKRVKAVGTYFAERREADRYQPEGWETAEGRALLSRYRAEMNGKTPAADLTRENTGATPTGRGVARVPSNGVAVGRHAAAEVADDTDHRPRHDGTQSLMDPSYMLTHPPTTKHGTVDPTPTVRVLTITNVVRGQDGDPLAGAIVTISLVADCSLPGLLPELGRLLLD